MTPFTVSIDGDTVRVDGDFIDVFHIDSVPSRAALYLRNAERGWPGYQAAHDAMAGAAQREIAA